MSAASVRQQSLFGFLHSPDEPNGNGLVLTHGAGSDLNAPLLVQISEAFSAVGWTVFRFNLAYRDQSSKGPPPRGSHVADRARIREAVTYMRAFAPGRLVMGGHSYGGRQASMLAAEEPNLADALLLLSYPLHPPRSTAMRTAHFPQMQTPALFVSGSKDPFGTPEEIETALRLIGGETELAIVDGAGHDLRSKRVEVDKLILVSLRRLLGV